MPDKNVFYEEFKESKWSFQKNRTINRDPTLSSIFQLEQHSSDVEQITHQ